MKWEIESLPAKKTTRLTVEWSDEELVHMNLEPGDLKLLRECAKSMRLSDHLLALELMALKIEQRELN